MRYPLQPMLTAAIGGCLLALVAACSPPGPSATPTGAAAARQPFVGVALAPAALTLARHGPAFSAAPGPAAVRLAPALPTPTPTRMRPTPGPKLSPEPDAKPPRKVSPDGRGQLPAEGDLRAGRPPHRPTSPATAADRAPGPAASPAAPVVHQIEAGDTVYQLAGQYGTSPEAILQANGLDEQGARATWTSARNWSSPATRQRAARLPPLPLWESCTRCRRARR